MLNETFPALLSLSFLQNTPSADMLYYPIITPFFLFFALLHTSNALPSRRSGTGGGSTTPGASLPYGDNSNGDSYLQSYSVGTAAFPAVYTQLSNAAWNRKSQLDRQYFFCLFVVLSQNGGIQEITRTFHIIIFR